MFPLRETGYREYGILLYYFLQLHGNYNFLEIKSLIKEKKTRHSEGRSFVQYLTEKSISKKIMVGIFKSTVYSEKFLLGKETFISTTLISFN